MYEKPLAAISKKDLDILTEERKKAGTLERQWIRPFSMPLKTRGKGKIHQSYPKPRVEDHTSDGARKRKGREGRTHGPGCFPWRRMRSEIYEGKSWRHNKRSFQVLQ